MRTVYSMVIDAEPNQVFYWLDDAEREMKWVPDIVEHEDLNITEGRIGSTFRQIYVENGRRMEMRGVVTGYEPNRRLTCEMKADSFDWFLDYRLEDLEGQTRLTQDCTVYFKGFSRIIGAIMAPIIKRSLMKRLKDSLAKLKVLSETSDEA